MTSETRKQINKPKAASAAVVGVPAAASIRLALETLEKYVNLPDEWQHIIAALVAGGMAAMAAYRTKDTSEQPTKWQQRKDAKDDARVEAALTRRENNGN